MSETPNAGPVAPETATIEPQPGDAERSLLGWGLAAYAAAEVKPFVDGVVQQAVDKVRGWVAGSGDTADAEPDDGGFFDEPG